MHMVALKNRTSGSVGEYYSNDKQIKKSIGKNISELKKYNIDVLGNKYEVQREELRFNVSL